MTRCVSCNRPVAPRWRKCPWCKGVSGQAWHPAFPHLDRQLNQFAYFGVPMGLWTGFIAVLLYLGHPPLGVAVGVFAVVVSASHALLAFHPLAWKTAEITWLLMALFVAAPLRGAPRLAALALIPAAVFAVMRACRRKLLDRLAGVAPTSWQARRQTPSRGPCSVCGRGEAEVVAPRYVLSVTFASFSFPGTFRSVCPLHARLFAIPAAIFSLLFGWWGFPWGFIWTPQAIVQDLADGGVRIGSEELEEMWRREVLEGGGSDAKGAFAFAMGLIVVPAVMIVPTMKYVSDLLFG